MLRTLLTILCVFSTVDAQADYAAPLARARYRAHAAYAVWTVTQGTVTPDTPPLPAGCKCNGTKKSGDGISGCICTKNGGVCKCIRSGDAPPLVEIEADPEPIALPKELPPVVPALPEKQVLFATQPGCIPCGPVVKALGPLVANGWTVGPGTMNQIRVIDAADPANAAILAEFKITFTPILLLLVKDPATGKYVEKGRRFLEFTGDVIDEWDFGELYHGKELRPKSRPRAKPPVKTTQAPAQTPRFPFRTYDSSQHWYHPVDLIAHLLDEGQHGISQHGYNRSQLERMQRLNPSLLESLHTDLHYTGGRSVQASSSYARQDTNCPTCPTRGRRHG